LPLINLLGDDYNTLCINLPGFGKSEPLKNFSVTRLIDDISEIICEYTNNNAILIGHSLGGVLGYLIALKNTEINKLVVLNSPIKRIHIPKPAIDYVDTFAKLASSNPIADVITTLKNSKLGSDFLDKFVANYVDKGIGEVNKAYGYNYVAETVGEANAKATKEYAQLLANLDITQEIKSLKTPTFGLFGKNDKNVVPKTADYLKSINPAVEVVLLDNMDHNGLMTQPDRVYKYLIDFINKR
jgi:pimeloyl-ACP methyl ester carboxylesterase